jgi:hypothetical protein
MTKAKFLKWWNSLPEAVRSEIYQSYNPEATDGDWGEWVYYMTEKEMEEVYEDNIEDTENTVNEIDIDAYISDGEFEARREIERGGY